MPVKGRGSKARYWHVRVRRPGEFQRKTFRTMPAVAGGSLLIVGRLKGRTSMTLQALRIPKAKFPSPAAALAHAKRLMSKRKRKRNAFEHPEKTAIGRKHPSLPLRWLLKVGPNMRRLPRKGRILDYGSGRGTDVDHLRSLGYNATGYDPLQGRLRPEFVRRPEGLFDSVYSFYVVNVRSREDFPGIIEDIQSFVAPGGTAWIAFRSDLYADTGSQRMVRREEFPAGWTLAWPGRGFHLYRWSPPATNPLVESAPGVRHWACDECGKPLERGHGTLCPRCVLQFMHERDVHAEHTREVELPGPGAAPAANPPDFPGYEDPEMPLIYPKTTRIEMNRGHGRFKGSPFYHNFSKTTPVAQHGLPAGAEVRLPSGRRFTLPSRGVLLHGPKPLWGKFPV